MLRKRFVCTGLVLIFAVLAGDARAEEKAKKPIKAKKAPFVHAVIFHLKKDAPAGEADAVIADSHKLLAKIGSVRGLWVGRPSDKGTPKIAKKFDVGLLVLFDDAEGLQKYIVDPLHVEFVKKHLSHFDQEQLAVFDFANQPAAKKEESK
jgi:hypothetical protein